jgi:hypothetical protein
LFTAQPYVPRHALIAIRLHQKQAAQPYCGKRVRGLAGRETDSLAADARATRHRRAKLLPQDRLECADLDTRLPAQETILRKADKGAMSGEEAALFESRKRYRELRC